jgi:hypothetical protein
MAFVNAMSPCYGCKRIFSYNPTRVPSLTIDGVKEPFCQNCINRANPVRIANGLPPIIPVTGAYEPCDESELDFSCGELLEPPILIPSPREQLRRAIVKYANAEVALAMSEKANILKADAQWREVNRLLELLVRE